MSYVTDRFVVILDANVLYPVRMRDTLLRFCEAGLFRARWSQMILDEWKRALLRRKPGLRANIEAQIEDMEIAFPEACVVGFADLIDTIHLPDPDDRHVVAAAIVADAEHIVTENLKDFPPETVLKFGIEAVSADDFLASTFELYPSQATAALRRMRKDYTNPHMEKGVFLSDLQSCGMPKLVSLAKDQIDAL